MERVNLYQKLRTWKRTSQEGWFTPLLIGDLLAESGGNPPFLIVLASGIEFW